MNAPAKIQVITATQDEVEAFRRAQSGANIPATPLPGFTVSVARLFRE